MLRTSLGTMTTARGSSASSGSTASIGSFQHFTGGNGQNLGDGRWRFVLEPVPSSVEWIDCDGATLYPDRTPGFSWAGAALLELSSPGGVLPADAQIHVRCGG